MDLATTIGIILGTIFITIAIIMGGNTNIFFNVPALFIVLGGTIATTFIKYPFSTVFSTLKVLKNAFFQRLESHTELIHTLTELSQVSRKEGILALESLEIKNSFLQKGIQYCVDGWEVSFIENILRIDMQFAHQRHQVGQEIFRGMGVSAPAFGMIGTLIGLVQMLISMDNPKTLGPAMAVALLTTFYGALFANFLAIPIADKLEYRSKQETLLKELIVEGIKGIMEGDNPRHIEHKLYSFLAPNLRKTA